ncbi:MAG: magnesium transporter [Bacteroidetes bacterium]|jgi:magnesium transporter|nr:magnesium transporter [Bacteroidota bacterium]
MEAFELSKEFLEEFVTQLDLKKEDELIPVLERLFPADIAETFDSLNLEQAVYVTSLLDADKKIEVLAELDPEVQIKFFKGFTREEIALNFIQNMDSDDAVDVLSVIDAEAATEILSYIPDKQDSLYLTRLLRYPDNTAGGLMGGELIKVNINWNVAQCTEEIRKQAEEVSKVFTVYVVDDSDILLGWVSLKKIILAKATTPISEIFDSNIKYATVTTDGEDIASTMQKYDLIALPIVDSLNRLLGRVTIDDVLDFVKEEADKDYQMLSGISQNVEVKDKVWVLSKARLPWLIIGLFGGVLSSIVIGQFDGELQENVQLALFMPLIMAMAGNIGVQSSSIIVQGLANNTIDSSSVITKLGKELMVALINGLVCSALLMGYGLIAGKTNSIMTTVSIALFAVILLAAVVGTVVPLILDRFKIDPALATGPFITTSNDLLGLFLYFMIGKMLI